MNDTSNSMYYCLNEKEEIIETCMDSNIDDTNNTSIDYIFESQSECCDDTNSDKAICCIVYFSSANFLIK